MKRSVEADVERWGWMMEAWGVQVAWEELEGMPSRELPNQMGIFVEVIAWPHEAPPVQATRVALMGDLVGQPLSKPEVVDVAAAMLTVTIQPSPSSLGEVQVDLPGLLDRGIELLKAAWARVQALWGGRVPPGTPIPASEPPPQPAPPPLEVEEYSKPNPPLPGWPSPEQRAAYRAEKAAASRKSSPPAPESPQVPDAPKPLTSKAWRPKRPGRL